VLVLIGEPESGNESRNELTSDELRVGPGAKDNVGIKPCKPALRSDEIVEAQLDDWEHGLNVGKFTSGVRCVDKFVPVNP
jgi:hypothetical protein